MIIAYYSRGGNVAHFVNHRLAPELGGKYDIKNIEEWTADENYILIAPSYDVREITDTVDKWLLRNNNNKHLKAVIGSGDPLFADEYNISAMLIMEDYDVPILGLFNDDGDIESSIDIAERIKEFAPIR